MAAARVTPSARALRTNLLVFNLITVLSFGYLFGGAFT
jgi:hypothetical protein